MGGFYSRFALFLQALLILFGAIFYIAAHPATLQYVLQISLKEAGITFKKAEGSLLFGFTLYKIGYEKGVKIERLDAVYTPARLLNPAPTIESVVLSGLDIYPNRFKKKKSARPDKAGFLPPPVTIERVAVKEGAIHLQPVVTFDISAKDLLMTKGRVAAEKLSAQIESEYGSVRLKGSLKDMAIRAEGDVSPAKEYIKALGRYIDEVPRTLPLRLMIDEKVVKLSTGVKEKLGLQDLNVSLSGITVDAEYLLKENYFKASARYDIEAPTITAHIRQSAIATLFGAYATKIEGGISKSEQSLPFKRFYIDAAGDPTVFMADTYAGPLLFSLYSEDYESFAIHAEAKPHKIDYIRHLPAILSKQYISMEANATARLKPHLYAEGVALLDGNYTFMKTYVELTEESLLVRSNLTPKKSGGVWKNVPDGLRSKIDMFVYLSKEKKILNLVAQKADLTLFEQKGAIEGWAHAGSLDLNAKGRVLGDGTVKLAFDASIDSLHEFLSDFNLTAETMIDAQIKSRFDLTVGEKLSLRYRTEIPWYLVEPDSQHIYYGLDSMLEGSLKGNMATIDRYSISFKDRRFDQRRPSIVSLDDNSTLLIERLSILDTLDLRGRFDFKKRSGGFTIAGKDAHYSGPEGKLTFDADIDVSISPKEISAEGEIAVEDALLTYRPPKEYVVEDDDIVIIQDIKEPSHTARRLNIHIYAKKPLIYRIPDISVKFIPDITLWKEPGKPFGILGVVKIAEGEIDASDKHFTVEPSQIYFGGNNPINPYLDIHISYELDFYRFNIYVGHTLAKPLFLFSSEPPMSQNDIMSYILFGTPAGEEFASSGEPGGSIAALLLGMGLKNAIGSATGIKFDTVNILSTPSGSFGIEVGKRVGKRVRIVYRNDTVSSFIIQYKASRSIRIDVDVKDTGQGITILYVKDMKYLPIFKPKKDLK